jgi:hypothetical protein
MRAFSRTLACPPCSPSPPPRLVVWDRVYGFDFSCIKKLALREPLVDTVEARALVTNACAVKVCEPYIPRTCVHAAAPCVYGTCCVCVCMCVYECYGTWRGRADRGTRTCVGGAQSIDIFTVQKADLAFTAPFSLTAQTNDYVHAFVAYFDCEFTCCHKPIHFSTGTHHPYHTRTHIRMHACMHAYRQGGRRSMDGLTMGCARIQGRANGTRTGSRPCFTSRRR